jgi:hypothetical protein
MIFIKNIIKVLKIKNTMNFLINLYGINAINFLIYKILPFYFNLLILKSLKFNYKLLYSFMIFEKIYLTYFYRKEN